MAGPAPYMAALAAAKPPMGAGPGAPVPGGPPPPSGVGAMNTGSPGSTPREAASAAVLALRDAQKHFPAMGPAIEGWVAQIIAAAKPGGVAPQIAGGSPPPPPSGAPPMAPVPSLDDAPPS